MSESSCGGFTCLAMWQRLKRKKQLDGDSVSRLDRCLTIPDLTLLSVGAMMGVGIYVLSGQVGILFKHRKLDPSILYVFVLISKYSILTKIQFTHSYYRFQKRLRGHQLHYRLL